MDSQFDNYLDIDRSNFVRYNPVFLKSIFGRTDILPFWVADTDFEVMPVLQEALSKRANSGIFAYETKSPALKQSLATWYETRYNIKVNSRRLLFMPSVNASIAAIIDEFTSPGDGVIIQPPVYQVFKIIIDGLGRETINNQLILEDNQYQIDFDDLKAKAQLSASKIMLLCSPHNPVGRVWSENELLEIARICTENNLLLITDEIHGDVVYKPNKYIGMASVYKQFGSNVIMVSSAGKSFGMPGLIDSFIFTPNNDYYKLLKLRVERFHLDKSNGFTNTAWQVVYENGGEWLDQMTAYLRENISFIASYLENEIPAIKLPIPEGTYQIWLDFRKLNHSNEELAKFLSQDSGLALNQGFTYGPGGDGFARMNIASPKSMIVDAMDRLKTAVGNRA
jgi:cystathionine beta-lyase